MNKEPATLGFIPSIAVGFVICSLLLPVVRNRKQPPPKAITDVPKWIVGIETESASYYTTTE